MNATSLDKLVIFHAVFLREVAWNNIPINSLIYLKTAVKFAGSIAQF